MPFDGLVPEVTTTLIAARQYIKENGWCRDFRRGKKACIVGALYTVTLDDYDPNECCRMPPNAKVSAACDVIVTGIPKQSIVEWNDLPSTNTWKVLELLDRAIERSMQG